MDPMGQAVSTSANSPGASTAAMMAIGATTTYGLGRTLGYLPGWFGPELPSWNTTKWNKEATAMLAELDSNPSFVCTMRTADGKSGRRVRIARYFSPSERIMRGVVKYGSDVEGPPRCVHGGCTAATSNQIAIDFTSNLLSFPVAYSSELDVDYLMKIPLGSQLGFDCHMTEGTNLANGEVVAKVRFFSLKNGSEYAVATVRFRNCQCISHL